MMTSETASDTMNSTNKRFETLTSAPKDLHITTSNKSGNTSSKDYALTSFNTLAVALYQHLSPIIKKSQDYINLLQNLIKKMNQLNKMNDDSEFTPRAARVVYFDF